MQHPQPPSRGPRARGWLALAALLLAAPAHAAPAPIRIGLLRHAQPAALTLESPAGWRAGRLAVPGGQPVSVRAAGQTLTLATAGSRVTAPSLRLEGPGPWTLSAPGVAARRYDGDLTLQASNGRLLPVLAQSLERYVEGAVAGEMLPEWPAAALEAQAIASRSYALASTGRHGGEGYDLCDLTHCQRFVAARFIDPRHAVAVERTRGRRLVAEGRVAEALWHSTCGGRTASNEAVFGGAPRPFLRGVPDASWCEDSPHFPAWSIALSRARLEGVLRAAGRLGPGEPLREVSVVDRLAEGTVLAVRLAGHRPREL
ncbi:MAG: SpoIID/LytB domain-containing protein, partial [Candidatus Sericytochromatia bacterium]